MHTSIPGKLMILICALSLSAPSSGIEIQCGTPLEGNYSEDVLLSDTSGNYTVIDNFSVSSDYTLTIAQGVTLIVEGNYSISAKFDIQGSISQPVTIKPSSLVSGSWHGLRLYSDSLVENAIISYAENGIELTGIGKEIYESVPCSIIGCYIYNCSNSGIFRDSYDSSTWWTSTYPDVHIEKCIIRGNGSHGLNLGIDANYTGANSRFYIYDNIIEYNGGDGIHCYGREYGAATLDIQYNSVSHNYGDAFDIYRFEYWEYGTVSTSFTIKHNNVQNNNGRILQWYTRSRMYRDSFSGTIQDNNFEYNNGFISGSVLGSVVTFNATSNWWGIQPQDTSDIFNYNDQAPEWPAPVSFSYIPYLEERSDSTGPRDNMMKIFHIKSILNDELYALIEMFIRCFHGISPNQSELMEISRVMATNLDDGNSPELMLSRILRCYGVPVYYFDSDSTDILINKIVESIDSHLPVILFCGDKTVIVDEYQDNEGTLEFSVHDPNQSTEVWSTITNFELSNPNVTIEKAIMVTPSVDINTIDYGTITYDLASRSLTNGSSLPSYNHQKAVKICSAFVQESDNVGFYEYSDSGSTKVMATIVPENLFPNLNAGTDSVLKDWDDNIAIVNRDNYYFVCIPLDSEGWIDFGDYSEEIERYSIINRVNPQVPEQYSNMQISPDEAQAASDEYDSMWWYHKFGYDRATLYEEILKEIIEKKPVEANEEIVEKSVEFYGEYLDTSIGTVETLGNLLYILSSVSDSEVFNKVYQFAFDSGIPAEECYLIAWQAQERHTNHIKILQRVKTAKGNLGLYLDVINYATKIGKVFFRANESMIYAEEAAERLDVIKNYLSDSGNEALLKAAISELVSEIEGNSSAYWNNVYDGFLNDTELRNFIADQLLLKALPAGLQYIASKAGYGIPVVGQVAAALSVGTFLGDIITNNSEVHDHIEHAKFTAEIESILHNVAYNEIRTELTDKMDLGQSLSADDIAKYYSAVNFTFCSEECFWYKVAKAFNRTGWLTDSLTWAVSDGLSAHEAAEQYFFPRSQKADEYSRMWSNAAIVQELSGYSLSRILNCDTTLVFGDSTSELNNPLITPGSSGSPEDSFIFSILYTDSDNQAPDDVRVCIGETCYSMSSSDTDYSVGVLFDSTAIQFPVGTYEYCYEALRGGNVVASTGPYTFKVIESVQDNDNDGISDDIDSDDDNDGWSDTAEGIEGTDPMNNASVPSDNDGDGIGDVADEDDDNDGYSDQEELNAGSDPNSSGSIPVGNSIDPMQSTIQVTSPHFADGANFALITITLRNSNGDLLPGRISANFTLISTGIGNDFGSIEEVSPGIYQSVLSSTISEVKFISTQIESALIEYTEPNGSQKASVLFMAYSENPVVTLLKPNGNEILHPEEEVDILWSAYDNDGISLVKIEYSEDNGDSWNIITYEYDSSSYTWEVPSIQSMNCRIRLTALDTEGNDANDISDLRFSITPMPSDDFDDNQTGLLWSIQEDNPDNIWINEVNQRVELESTLSANEEDARYLSNNWGIISTSDFKFRVDFNYEPVTSDWGEIYIGIGPVENTNLQGEENYISFAVGCDSENPIFWYEKFVDGVLVDDDFDIRTSSTGTLYISYNSSLDELYLSHTGYGIENAWITVSGLLHGEWVDKKIGLAIGGYSEGVVFSSGQAYLDSFIVEEGNVVNLTPDINHDMSVDVIDLAKFGDEWLRSNCGLCGGAEYTGDGFVTFEDFAFLASYWLEDLQFVTETEDDFETGDFSILPWQHSGNSNWMIATDDVYGGTYSAKSGTITHNQISELEVTLDCTGFNTISFARKVSSESGYDYLKFYVDGLKIAEWSGSQDWAEESYSVTSGQHTFKWVYEKDVSISNGSDCAWIDNVSLSNEEIIGDDFETGDFSTLPWQHPGDGIWTITTDEVYSGSYSAKSGAINHDQTSELQVTLDCTGFSSISFARKVSCELWDDRFAFYIDGSLKYYWTGESSWGVETFSVTSGLHTFKWAYEKNESISSGSDCAWIDNIKLNN